MDTRNKIVTEAEAARAAAGGATVVSGYFDPLVASHAEQLAELKKNSPLIVVIATPERPILPARARAELVASLRIVDFVVDHSNGLAPHVNLEAEDSARLHHLIDHVHARQNGGAKS